MFVYVCMYSVWDCFELGRLAYNEEDYFHTILWMEEALVRHRAEGQDTDDAHIFTANIIDYLAFSLYKVCCIKVRGPRQLSM